VRVSAALADMTPGLRDAIHDAQQIFRTVLNAMTRPGRAFALPPTAIDGAVPPPGGVDSRPMSIGAAAVLLTLLDSETGVRAVGALASTAVTSYLRFHTGAATVVDPCLATFVVAGATELDAGLCEKLTLGTDEAPHDGATAIVEVDGLDHDDGMALLLSGPGIETSVWLQPIGVCSQFWDWQAQIRQRMPRGIDLILVHGSRITAVPRTTRVEFQDASRA
jgi:alpha-D-ribose 1-methylphosphonate 5-triphosphate synthase subunit PhnH